MSKLRSIIFAAAVISIFGAPLAANASGITTDETFVFTGTCTVDCAGTATGILTLTGYTQGTSLSAADFVSFDYMSNDDNYDYTKNGSTVVTGLIPVDLPADANITIQGVELSNFSFVSDASTGGWCVGYGPNLCTPESNADKGLNGSLSATPLPATLPLFAGGLGFVGYLTRRRERSAK
ncbi:MAG TPA: hypothetical protein VIY68_20575 [Steroidobacteraceae bacterium]